MPATAQIENPTWDVVLASKMWRKLSAQRRVFLTAYVANGEDAIAATRTAYPKANDKSVVCMSYELRKHPDIVAALDLWRGNDLQQLLEQVRVNLAAAKPGSVAAQRLLAQKERLLGLDGAVSAEPSEAPRRKYKIGDSVTQAGHTGRVLAIDTDGQPTQVEEIQ
jgi:hypothetical protein